MYHCSVKNIGRSGGGSAVASSAYRSGEKLIEQETGEVHDYTRKSGVVHSEISLCENAPKEYEDRQTLWNEVHKIEKNNNARLSREVEVALPREFDTQKQIEVVREYTKNFTKNGMCADWSIHDKKDGNPHAHIMLTTRKIKEDGKWGAKEKKAYALDEKGERIPMIDKATGEQKLDSRNRKQWKRETVQANDWNKKERVEEWRESWAKECNKHLNQDKQLDHRSYERQGIEKIPTIHEGHVARDIEKRGGVSERCEANRNIKQQNVVLEKLKDAYKTLSDYKAKFTERLKAINTKPFNADEVAKQLSQYKADYINAVNQKQQGAYKENPIYKQSAEKLKHLASTYKEQSKSIDSMTEQKEKLGVLKFKEKKNLESKIDGMKQSRNNTTKEMAKLGVDSPDKAQSTIDKYEYKANEEKALKTQNMKPQEEPQKILSKMGELARKVPSDKVKEVESKIKVTGVKKEMQSIKADMDFTRELGKNLNKGANDKVRPSKQQGHER